VQRAQLLELSGRGLVAQRRAVATSGAGSGSGELPSRNAVDLVRFSFSLLTRPLREASLSCSERERAAVMALSFRLTLCMASSRRHAHVAALFAAALVVVLLGAHDAAAQPLVAAIYESETCANGSKC
jgi:hypothetical protein